MCKIEGVNTGIKKLAFGEQRGKMVVCLTDGREVAVPLSFFPDIKKLSMKHRKQWMVLDEQFFTFAHLSKVYSLQDIMKM